VPPQKIARGAIGAATLALNLVTNSVRTGPLILR